MDEELPSGLSPLDKLKPSDTAGLAFLLGVYTTFSDSVLQNGHEHLEDSCKAECFTNK